MAALSRSKFGSLNEEELGDLSRNKDSENTLKVTKKAVAIFCDYLTEKNLPTDFKNFDKVTLGKLLAKFYVEVRRENGDHYKTASLHNIRAGLNRYLKNEYRPVSGWIDILRDKEFIAANVAYRAVIVELKQIGKGDVQHQAIGENDIAKLYSSGAFDQNSPTGLQRKVWFELMLYICRRGNLRELKKDHFVVSKDSDGRQYVAPAVDELAKKTREVNQSPRADAGRIYETCTDQCPVLSFKKYKSKLNPDCEAFFQAPKVVVPSNVDSPWYKKTPVGKNILGNFMGLLSSQARLSRRYTNHCIRTTFISILDSKGFSARDNCQTSGRANKGGLTSYIGKASDCRKQELSDAISHSIGLKPYARAPDLNISHTKVSATVSKAPENDPSLDLHDLDVECTVVGSQDMDLGMTGSQLAYVEEITDHDDLTADNTNDQYSLTIDPAMSPKTLSTVPVPRPDSLITSSTTRRTIQVQSSQQQSPFVLNNSKHDSKGFSARDDCQTSGRANKGSLTSYIGKASDCRKQELSDAISHSIGLKPLARAPDLNISQTKVSATVSKAPENDPSLDLHDLDVECTVVGSQDMDLGMTGSQLAYVEEITDHDDLTADNTNDQYSLTIDPAMSPKTLSTVPVPRPDSLMTSSTTRRTMQVQSSQQQSPFVLNNSKHDEPAADLTSVLSSILNKPPIQPVQPCTVMPNHAVNSHENAHNIAEPMNIDDHDDDNGDVVKEDGSNSSMSSAKDFDSDVYSHEKEDVDDKESGILIKTEQNKLLEHDYTQKWSVGQSGTLSLAEQLQNGQADYSSVTDTCKAYTSTGMGLTTGECSTAYAKSTEPLTLAMGPVANIAVKLEAVSKLLDSPNNRVSALMSADETEDSQESITTNAVKQEPAGDLDVKVKVEPMDQNEVVVKTEPKIKEEGNDWETPSNHGNVGNQSQSGTIVGGVRIKEEPVNPYLS